MKTVITKQYNYKQFRGKRQQLYEYLKTLNPQDFKEVDVVNPRGIYDYTNN